MHQTCRRFIHRDRRGTPITPLCNANLIHVGTINPAEAGFIASMKHRCLFTQLASVL
jgi:hypothetical protein